MQASAFSSEGLSERLLGFGLETVTHTLMTTVPLAYKEVSPFWGAYPSVFWALSSALASVHLRVLTSGNKCRWNEFAWASRRSAAAGSGSRRRSSSDNPTNTTRTTFVYRK